MNRLHVVLTDFRALGAYPDLWEACDNTRQTQDIYPASLFCASIPTRVTLCQLNDEDRGNYQTTPNEGSWQLPHGRRTANHPALTRRGLCA